MEAKNLLLSVDQTVSKDGNSSSSSSHRFKCESDLDVSGSKAVKRQKVNYDYEEDSYNDYEDDGDEDESDDDDEANEQGAAHGYMLLGSSSAHNLAAFGEHSFAGYSNFGFDSTGVTHCGGFSAPTGRFSAQVQEPENTWLSRSAIKQTNITKARSKTSYPSSSGSTSSDSMSSSSSKTKSHTGQTGETKASAKKSTKKSPIIELKTEPTVVSDVKLKAYDLNQRQESSGVSVKSTKSMKGKNSVSSSSSSLDVAKNEATTVPTPGSTTTAKNGVENETKTGGKRKNVKSQDQATDPTSTGSKTTKSNASKKSTTETSSKKSNVNSKSKKGATASSQKAALDHSNLGLVNPIECTLLNGLSNRYQHIIPNLSCF